MSDMLGFYTLNARDNFLFHWIFLEAAKSDPRVFQEAMQVEAAQLRRLLSSRGIRYDDLKTSLVPTGNGRQAAFLYDWWEDDSWNYAVAFAEKFLPSLRNDMRTSVLHGDLHEMQGAMPIGPLEAALVKPRSRSVNWRTQYAVYFNNVQPRDIVEIHGSLVNELRYTGYLDVSFTSSVRDFLSRTLTSHWVVHGRKIVLSHGNDDQLLSNEDPVGYGLSSYGYDVVSLMESYFAGFLSYKIEATEAPRTRDDRTLNLAAITGELIDTQSVRITVPPAKLDQYLLRDASKLRLMTSVGLEDVTPSELASIVKTKLSQSYVYDLRFATDGTPLFAIAGEFEKPGGGLTRRLLALKYDRSRGMISLVTMY